MIAEPPTEIVRPPNANRLATADNGFAIEFDEARKGFKVVSPDGRICLCVYLGSSGPVLELAGSGLTIQTAGALAFSAERVDIEGRQGVTIRSGADAAIDVAGDLSLTARAQTLTADLGDIDLKANDDVKLNGERVRMNC